MCELVSCEVAKESEKWGIKTVCVEKKFLQIYNPKKIYITVIEEPTPQSRHPPSTNYQ